MSIPQPILKSLKLIIIKIGTRLLVSETGNFYRQNVSKLVNEINTLKSKGYSVVLVTSGSVGFGMSVLKYKNRPKNLSEKQACAAVGQIKLMQFYSETFNQINLTTAQLLVSADDFKTKDRCNNIKNTIQCLLKQNVIPIINENDTVSTQELKIGDNDTLSVNISHFLQADLLILLSDEKGFYDKNPKKYSDARLFSVVSKINHSHIDLAKSSNSQMSVGGMRSKIKAIQKANQGGIPVVLTSIRKNTFSALLQGKSVGTLFLPSGSKLHQNKVWLAFISPGVGQVIVDKGAEEALKQNKSSLLAVGVVSIKGVFSKGDFVNIYSIEDECIGRGQVNMSSEIIHRIKGLIQPEVKKTLKTKSKLDIIHKDKLIIYSV